MGTSAAFAAATFAPCAETDEESEPDPAEEPVPGEEPQAAIDTTATDAAQAAATFQAVRRRECPPGFRVPG